MSNSEFTAYHDSPLLWKDLLLRGLAEDQWTWDFTTLGTQQKPDSHASAKVLAKDKGIWACEGLVEAGKSVSNEMGLPLQMESSLKNGEGFKPSDTLVQFKGPARAILALERPFLNLAAYACGIATQTHSGVDQVTKACPKNPPRITLTRKTLPYYRDIAIHSVICGGGSAHRVSLGGGVLVKENHIAAGGGVSRVLTQIQKSAPHSLRIEIEVKNLSELDEALEYRPEAVLLDNFEPQLIIKALEKINKLNPRPIVEISGRITDGNISSYAISGVNVISMGALTHSVRSVDLSLIVDFKK